MREGAAFECHFEVRWADLDGNRHVRNTAFSEYATHTRFRLLAAHGFAQAQLEQLRFGPVMMREEIRYRWEVHFGDALVVNVSCAGLSAYSSHWRCIRMCCAPMGGKPWCLRFSAAGSTWTSEAGHTTQGACSDSPIASAPARLRRANLVAAA